MLTDRLAAKIERRDRLSEAERAALESLISHVERLGPRENIAVENVEQTSSRLLLEGVACRYKQLTDGRRQITELHIDGDFVDLHSFTLKRLDHNVGAITAVQIGVVPHDELRKLTETHPHLTRMLWLMTMIDAAIHREWLVSAGRRSALEQVASLFCEIYVRSQVTGLAQDASYPLPLTQEDMADVCGLTAVHVNRTLQELRSTGAVEWQRGTVTVRDWGELQRIAGFDPAYLNLFSQPR